MPSGLRGSLEGRDLDIRQTVRDRSKKKTEDLALEFSNGGLAGWLLGRFRRRPDTSPRLTLVERINLAPHQTLVLVEAEGRRLLVATSREGAPSFYSLDEHASPTRFGGSGNSSTYRRVTW